MDIDERIKRRFNKKTLNFHRLLEMVEQQLDNPEVIEEKEEGGRFSMTIPLPSFSPTEAWGDPDSQDRQQVIKVFSVVRGGRDIKQKIQNINSFLDPATARMKRSPGVIIDMMTVIEAVQATLNDFNESAAGFVFEAFMAALTGGHQQTARIGGTLPIEDFVAFSDYGGDSGVPVSLKLLTVGGTTKGSYTNIVDYLVVRGAPMIKYIVAFKRAEEGKDNVGELQFWEFEINRGNFIDFIEGIGDASLLAGDIDVSELKQLAQNYSQSEDRSAQMELAQALFLTAGYNRRAGEAGGKIAKWLERGGLTPEEWEEVRPEEEEEAERKKKEKKIRTRVGKGERGREAAIAKSQEKGRTIATSKEDEQTGHAEIREHLQESFHKREKRLMQESLLLKEAGEGDTQWGATWGQLDKLDSVINFTSYGIIDLTQPRIDGVAKIYIEKLKGSVMILLEKTKSLAENIGSYFREEKRNKANAAAEVAKDDAKEIRKAMAKDPRYAK